MMQADTAKCCSVCARKSTCVLVRAGMCVCHPGTQLQYAHYVLSMPTQPQHCNAALCIPSCHDSLCVWFFLMQPCSVSLSELSLCISRDVYIYICMYVLNSHMYLETYSPLSRPLQGS